MQFLYLGALWKVILLDPALRYICTLLCMFARTLTLLHSFSLLRRDGEGERERERERGRETERQRDRERQRQRQTDRQRERERERERERDGT